MNKYLQKIIQDAFDRKISDVYFLPEKENYKIKFHDGQDVFNYRLIRFSVAEKLFSYLKFRAQMNITENRRPQVGSIDFLIESGELALRISTVSDFKNQETMVIRLLYDKANIQLNWLNEDQLIKIKNKIPTQGLVLIAGPTGSGKSTTIHQIISSFSRKKLVLTIEDPVEVRDERLLQLQVNNDANMGYISLIKAALRHHPDLLMIGEIRDKETAQATVQAALSGHLVFSTIHANSPLAVKNRLLELGVDLTILKQVFKLSIYQRLIKKRNGSLAALVDWMDAGGLFSNEDLRKDSDFSDEWEKILNEALVKEQISKETCEKYLKIIA
ncbi:competence type IV pilus ATPase ComGA [Oenococcus alcoholitolerans]|uniref:competence type IV pilus ATPase ComGA n=1 Tax=Oenococcus alcoholitolerans TaxID=931074 RepID=UPI003F7302DD